MAAAFTISVFSLVCVTFVYAVKLSRSWNYSQHQPLAREEQRTKNRDKGSVYMGPDKSLHGQKLIIKFHLALTRDRRNWKNFWTAKCASLGPEKSRSSFWPARFHICTDSCKRPNRATFCSDSVVMAWNGLNFARIRVNSTVSTATEFAQIQVNRQSRDKICPCKNLPGPV